jgi:hypothetical protein
VRCPRHGAGCAGQGQPPEPTVSYPQKGTGQSGALRQYPLRIGYLLWMGSVQTRLAET